MKRMIALVIATTVLAGCATTTPTTQNQIAQNSLTACKEMVSVTKTMTKIKPLLPPDVQKKVGDSLATAYGYCHTPTPPTGANGIVQGIFSSLKNLAKEVAAAQKGASK